MRLPFDECPEPRHASPFTLPPHASLLQNSTQYVQTDLQMPTPLRSQAWESEATPMFALSDLLEIVIAF